MEKKVNSVIKPIQILKALLASYIVGQFLIKEQRLIVGGKLDRILEPLSLITINNINAERYISRICCFR